MAPTIAIIGALEKEVRHIYQALDGGEERNEMGLHIVLGTYRGARVVATCAGMGTVNAAAATQHLISAYGARAVVFSGIAGGLNPALHIGDIVVGARLRYLDSDTALIAESAPELEEFASSPKLVAIASEVLHAHGYREPASSSADELQFLCGTIATGNRFISGTTAKALAQAATQADCVEMEGAAVAHVAAKCAVPCLVLRAISDNCDEAYDALSARVFDLESYARNASEIALEIIARMSACPPGRACGDAPEHLPECAS